jgi:ArsR family transcriptional regulator
LADPKRLLILNALRNGELSVTEICDEVGFAQANVSQHLAVLRDRGLVLARKEGQYVYYSVASPKIIEALDLLRQVMTEQAVSPVA